MKRIAISIIVYLVTIVCQAQEHLQFLGIPICGTFEQFGERLVKEKGFIMSDSTIRYDEKYKRDVQIFNGCFEDYEDCLIIIRQLEDLNEISSVAVCIDTLKYDDNNIKMMIDKYDKKYGSHTGFWGTNKWDLPNGRILAQYDEDYYVLVFQDKTEIDITDKKLKEIQDSLVNQMVEIRKEEQTVREICGVQFGSSYEKAKQMLENKYGYPDYNPDKTSITYNNKTYAGISFDSIHFLFQSDGFHSYMNGCIFILKAKSLSDAKKKQEMLHKKLSDKYFMIDGTDNNGNRYYLGGYSPLPEDESAAFSIEILKYDDKYSRLYEPYATRLYYGRFNYVKEEF